MNLVGRAKLNVQKLSLTSEVIQVTWRQETALPNSRQGVYFRSQNTIILKQVKAETKIHGNSCRRKLKLAKAANDVR